MNIQFFTNFLIPVLQPHQIYIKSRHFHCLLPCKPRQVILEEKLNEPERYEHLIHNLAKRVEYVIYRDARSFDSYANVTTLRNRVKHSLWEMKRTMLAGRRMACTRKSKPKIRARAA